uniref:Uncharacterized protein n=1 Tax=Molossus molossus TaxID=27622 RepID=A0A7J8FA93_MOLMO|nr:hypothetical protein HJG59_008600 [Molossus molossus]
MSPAQRCSHRACGGAAQCVGQAVRTCPRPSRHGVSPSLVPTPEPGPSQPSNSAWVKNQMKSRGSRRVWADSALQPPAQGPGPRDGRGGAGVPVGTEQAQQEGACLRSEPRGDFIIDSASQTRRWGPPSEGGTVPGTDLTGKVLAARKQGDESGEGDALPRKGEQLPSHRSLLITSHSLKEKEKNEVGKGPNPIASAFAWS